MTLRAAQVKAALVRSQHSEFSHITIVAQDATVRKAPDTEGKAGDYDIRVVLGAPGTALYRADLDLSQFAEEGDSLLQLPSGVPEIRVRVVTDSGLDHEIRMVRNADGRLAAAELRLHGQNLADAETRALDLLRPLLSWWSVRYDVALEVVGWVIAEVSTGTLRTSLGLLGRVKPLVAPFDDVSLEEEVRLLLGAYRQGLAATDLFVAVLSYWRVIEGVRARRAARREHAKTSGLVVAGVEERIPRSKEWLSQQDAWLQRCFTQYQGKKFGAVTDLMRETLRNALAHLDPTKPVLSLDRQADRDACLMAIPVLRYMARTVLREELGTRLGGLFVD